MQAKQKRQKQLSFWKPPAKSHGGEERLKQRKIARPLATDRALHVTLKSDRAKGPWNLLKHEKRIDQTLQTTAKLCQIRLYRCVNVGNHLHLTLKGRKRRDLQKFFRVLPQAIVFLVTKTRKGNPIGRFWRGLIHTRIIEWGQDWRRVNRYLDKNQIEAVGIPRSRIDKWFKIESG